jgi:Rrf2 family protein
MRLSRESRYAVQALVFMAARAPEDGYVGAREIAAGAGLPVAYLHKILRQLTVGGLLRSRRGAGYALARPIDRIALRDVLSTIEGPKVFGGRCIFWREECSEADPCELHFVWKELEPTVEARIGVTTLAEIATADTEHR